MRVTENQELDALIEKNCTEEIFRMINLLILSHQESNTNDDGLIYAKKWLSFCEEKGGLRNE